MWIALVLLITAAIGWAVAAARHSKASSWLLYTALGLGVLVVVLGSVPGK
jgi:hypothetical protein